MFFSLLIIRNVPSRRQSIPLECVSAVPSLFTSHSTILDNAAQRSSPQNWHINRWEDDEFSVGVARCKISLHQRGRGSEEDGGWGGWRLAQRHWESAPPASDRDSWSRISGSGSMSVSSGSATGRRRSHPPPDPLRS